MTTKKIKVQEYYAVFQEESEGGFSVWIPSLPGCTSQGETFEEALANIKEALELYLESNPNVSEEQSQKQFLVPVKLEYA